jgi:hypothetical protein
MHLNGRCYGRLRSEYVVAQRDDTRRPSEESTYFWQWHQHDTAEDNEDDQAEHQLNVAKVSNEKVDEEKKDKPLLETCDEPRQLPMSRDRKPRRKTGATMSLKDRMRSLNASCSSMGSYTDRYFGENFESSRVRKVSEMKSEEETLNSKGKVQAALKESDVGDDDLEDYEASKSSLNAIMPDLQTKNQVTYGNGTNTTKLP